MNICIQMDALVVELTEKIRMLEMKKEKESRSVLHELEKTVEEKSKVCAYIRMSVSVSYVPSMVVPVMNDH